MRASRPFCESATTFASPRNLRGFVSLKAASKSLRSDAVSFTETARGDLPRRLTLVVPITLMIQVFLMRCEARG
jgi:hypothetical protein